MPKSKQWKGPRGFGWAWFTFLLLLWGTPAGFAQEAYFNDIIVTNNTEDLLLYATLEGPFSKEVDEALFNGIPLTVTYNIRLLRERAVLTDEEITSLRIQHQLTYDITKGLCQFTWEEPLKKGSRATRNLPTAMKWMKELSGVKVAAFRGLPSERRYYILIKADIRQGGAGFPLNFMGWFFKTGTNLSTPWQRASFLK